MFAGHRGPFEAWDTLPLLDDRVALKFIMPEKYYPGCGTMFNLSLDTEELSTNPSFESTADLPFLRPKNSSHVVIMGTGHLVGTRNQKIQ